MDILTTIIPIFTIIILGCLAQRKGFLPPEFLNPANRLVYHIAIPALIFNAISQTTISRQLNPPVIALMLVAAIGAYAVAWLTATGMGLPLSQRGTYVQCAAHGNLGYIGLAVAYYFMGDDGLTRAGVAAGFLMILQNLMSVIVLQAYSFADRTHKPGSRLIVKVFGNPVILSAMAGILFSLIGLTLPLVLRRSLEILSGMALPTALLLIGATLSFEVIYKYLKIVLSVAVIKLVALPLIGLMLFSAFNVPVSDYMPVLILLASPTATIAYVMAKEMQGDPDVAVAAISALTLFSAVSFTFWLHLAA